MRLRWLPSSSRCLAYPAPPLQIGTGCLTRAGDIVNVAMGDEPRRPCRSNQSAITLSSDGDDQEDEGIATVPFFFEMADGEERTILTSGSTEIFARCQIDVTFRGPNQDVVSIVTTSSEDGWFASGGLSTPSQEPTQARLAGEESIINVVMNGDNHPDGTVFGREQMEDAFSSAASTSFAPHGAVITPAGTFIRVEVDLALNMFGHDCIAVGTATVIHGDPE